MLSEDNIDIALGGPVRIDVIRFFQAQAMPSLARSRSLTCETAPK